MAAEEEEEDTFDKAMEHIKYAFKTAMKYVDQDKTGPDLYNSLWFLHNNAIRELRCYKQ